MSGASRLPAQACRGAVVAAVLLLGSRCAATPAPTTAVATSASSPATRATADTRPLEPGHIHADVASRSDPTQSFALYVPSTYVPTRRWPVLFVLDPRSRGRLGAELFREGAERHGWLVFSSNQTASDGPWEPNVRAMKAMLADADLRFAIDPRRLYVAGFSGTARGAWALALGLTPNVAGVIVASGGAPIESPPTRELPFAVFATAGTHDFNYQEMQALDRTLDDLNAPHRFETFAGEHAWPPATLATDAIAWLELAAMRSGKRSLDRALVTTLARVWLGEAARLEAEGLLEVALHRYREIERDLAGLVDAGAELESVRAGIERVNARPELATERDARERALEWERSQRQLVERGVATLASASGAAANDAARDLRAALDTWREKARVPADPAQADAAARVVEHLASFVAFYTPRELRQHRAFARAALALELAVAIHGDRPTLWYDLACARARAGKHETALDALAQAVTLGFADRALLESDPDLESVRDEPRFGALRDQLVARDATVHP